MTRSQTTPAMAFFAGLMLVLGLSSPAEAQDDESRFSGLVQLDVTNAYFFRGILQEREGVILQPWAELYYSLYSSEDGFLRDVTIGGGMWHSFHSERTLADAGVDGGDQNQWWYESDYYPLMALGFAGGVSLTTIYYFYTSPNDAFTTVQELNFKLAWDDSEAFGRLAVQPWVNLAIETVNTSFGPSEGVGMQAGIGPTLYAAEDESFTLTLPAEVGLALTDYYEYQRFDPAGAPKGTGENSLGYANVGLALSIPLGFVPESAGAWSLGLTGKYFFFNDTLEDANRGRGSYPVGVASLSVEF